MRADRLLTLMLRLQQKGKQTAAELATALNVSDRTIYRDIDALCRTGVPIYAEGGPGGGYRLVENYRTSLTGLNDREVHALFSLAVSNHVAALGATSHLSTALLKLSAALPQRYQDQMERTEQRLYLDNSRWFQKEPTNRHLQTLQRAVWQDCKIDIHYTRQNGTTNRRIVSPYALVAKGGIWYLVAQTEVGLRVYRVSRIDEVILLEARFVRLPDFNLPTFWQTWMIRYEETLPTYSVTLIATKEAKASLIYFFGESSWKSAEVLNGQRQLTVQFEREEEALIKLLSLGNAVTILQPDRLRHLILEKAHSIISHYG